jgi:4-amino-4-deoxy-L-arabinose transferase-like glycosyltransferase
MAFRKLAACAGLALVVSAVLVPSAAFEAGLRGVDPRLSREGIALFRAALGALAAALFATVWRWPRAGKVTGLPPRLLGLAENSSAPASPRTIAALLLVTLLAAVLRIVGLNHDLWLDEIATTVNYLRNSPLEILSTYRSANQHLLYSLLGSVSFSVFGESAWSARLPAVVLGVGAIPGLYVLARRVAPEGEALWAALLLAVSYHHIWFSQSARGYSGMIFFTVWGTVLLLQALERDRRRSWVLYALCAALGVLMLQNAAFVFAGHLMACALLLPWRSTAPEVRKTARSLFWRVAGALAWAALTALAAYALQVPQIVHFFRTVDRTGLGAMSVGQFLPVLADGLRAGFGGAAVLALLACAAAGWLDFWQRNPLIPVIAVLPPVLNLVALVVIGYGGYPRSFLYVLPFALLLVVRGAAVFGGWARRHGWALPMEPAKALLAALLLASAVALIPLYRYPKQDYTGALAFVAEQKGPGDRVGAVGLAAVAYREYYAPGLLFPGDPAELAALREGHDMWILYSFPRDMRLRFSPLYDYLEENFRIEARFRGTLGDGDVYVARAERIDQP